MLSRVTVRKIFCAMLAFSVAAGTIMSAAAQDSRPRYSSRQSGDRSWTIPPDTVISMTMRTTLTSRTARVGDKFTATVTIPVYVNGKTVIPAGSVVEGRITQVTPAKRMSKSGTIGVGFDAIVLPNGSRIGVNGTLTSDDPETRRTIDDESRVSGEAENRSAVFVGGGGAVGAVIGGMAGGGKGAVLGGIIGAGAGVAGVLLSKGEEAQVPSGTPFGLQLQEPLTISESNISEGGPRGGRDSYPPETTDYRNQPDDPGPDRSDVDDPVTERTPPIRPQPEKNRSERPELIRPRPEPANAPAPALPLSSPEMVRRAQNALKEQGYFEGQADGTLGPRTTAALRTYQKEHNLPETGDLDPQTAKSLGILGASDDDQPDTGDPAPVSERPADRNPPANIVMANVLSATANRTADGAIQVLINTQANTGGWRWFGEHVVNGDTLEVYARAERPTGIVTQALSRGRIELNVRNGVEYVRRVVVHSAGADMSIAVTNRANPAPVNTTTVNSVTGLSLQRQTEELLSEYQRAIGVRLTSSGVELSSGRRYREPEISLLFAIDNLVNAAQLYSRLSASLQDREAARGATLALARQARRADLVITSTSAWSSYALDSRWDSIRQDVLKLMQAFGIDASELDN